MSRLQEENRRLLKEQSPNHTYLPVTPTTDNDMLQRLKDSVEKQRDEIRLKEKLLQEKNLDVDNVNAKLYFSIPKTESVYFSVEISSGKANEFQQGVTTEIQVHAGPGAHVVRRTSRFPGTTPGPAKRHIGAETETGARSKRERGSGKSTLCVAFKVKSVLHNFFLQCDLPIPSNKAVYDLDDPNRPRFTTQELKDILHERNELKARVSDLEDELETYRPKNKAET